MVPKATDLHFVCDCACGENFTVTVDRHGRVHQMGSMGVEKSKTSPWEGARAPVQVGGDLLKTYVTFITAGSHHVIAVGCPKGRSSDDVRQPPPVLLFFTI